MIASGCILTAINYIKLNDEIMNITLNELHKLTCIEVDCLRECKEQIEELVESNFQAHPEFAEKFQNEMDC